MTMCGVEGYRRSFFKKIIVFLFYTTPRIRSLQQTTCATTGGGGGEGVAGRGVKWISDPVRGI